MKTQAYGEFIKRHRLASGYKSQRALAEKTGINNTTISRIEKEEQKPEKRTLQTLAEYLTTTSYVELMVVCGYWDEDELLEPVNEDVVLETYSSLGEIDIDGNTSDGSANGHIIRKGDGIYKKETPTSNEEELVNNIELSDEELIKKFSLRIDGKPLNDMETQGILAYIRSLRKTLKS